MPDIPGLVADLRAEGDGLVAILRDLAPGDWSSATPAQGWDISAQVAHVRLVEERALTSLTDPETYQALRARDQAEPVLVTTTESYRQLPPDRLLESFIDVRARFTDAVLAADPATRLDWYGPPMSLASMVTARLMETWAHGQDIRDALGLPPSESARLRHIARLGVATRGFSFANRELAAPTEPVDVQLRAPDGETWVYGDEGAPHRVRGTALDFCLVVTQRRHVFDTGLKATPGPASDWLAIAQAFAGRPGEGRRPGQFGVLPESAVGERR